MLEQQRRFFIRSSKNEQRNDRNHWLGPVRINTELKEVMLVRALTASGDYVNVVKKKVSRNKKAAEKAALNYRHWLKELEAGYFMLLIDEPEPLLGNQEFDEI